MLTLAASLGLGPSRASIRLIAPIACRGYNSSHPTSRKHGPTQSEPTSQPSLQSSHRTAAQAAHTGSPVKPKPLKTSPSSSSTPRITTQPPPSWSKASTAGPSKPGAWTKPSPSKGSKSPSSSPASSDTSSSPLASDRPPTSTAPPKSPRPKPQPEPSPTSPKPSPTPPPISTKSPTVGPSKTPPPTWTKVAKPSVSSTSRPSSVSPTPSSSLKSSTFPAPSPNPPLPPAPAPTPTDPVSVPSNPSPYRDPSKPRFAKQFDWPWDEMDSEDPDLIVEERVVYARPTAAVGWTHYKAIFGYVLILIGATNYAVYLWSADIPPPPDKGSPDGYGEKVFQIATTASYTFISSPFTLPLFTLFALFTIRSISRNHLQPVKRIVQTRSRVRYPQMENGQAMPGQQTVTTYLVTRNMDGLPQWFRNLFKIPEYREIDPRDVSIRQYWGGSAFLIDLHGASRQPGSFNKGIIMGMDQPKQEVIDLAKTTGHPLVLSESRLKAVFGEVGPVKDGWVRKTWKATLGRWW